MYELVLSNIINFSKNLTNLYYQYLLIKSKTPNNKSKMQNIPWIITMSIGYASVQNMLNIVKNIFSTYKRPNLFCRNISS